MMVRTSEPSGRLVIHVWWFLFVTRISAEHESDFLFIPAAWSATMDSGGRNSLPPGNPRIPETGPKMVRRHTVHTCTHIQMFQISHKSSKYIHSHIHIHKSPTHTNTHSVLIWYFDTRLLCYLSVEHIQINSFTSLITDEDTPLIYIYNPRFLLNATFSVLRIWITFH